MKTSRSEAAGPRRGRTRATAGTSPPRTRSSPARSPARTRRASPPATASAAAPRSPARRSPARRSPARRSPARRSPARNLTTRKSPVISPVVPARKSLSRRPAVKSEETIEPKLKLNEPTGRIVRKRRSEYSIKDLSIGLTQVEMSVNRVNGLGSGDERTQSSVAPQSEAARSGSALRDSDSRLSESASRSLDLPLEDDSDEEPTREKLSPVRKLATPLRGSSIGKATLTVSRWEFGGRIGSILLIVLLPAWVLGVLVQCARSCSFRTLQLGSVEVAALFSWRASALVASQVTLQTLVTSVRILGHKDERMDEFGKQNYFNSLFASILTLCAINAVGYFKILSVQSILEEYLRLAILFYILATLLAVVLFLKSRKIHELRLNPYGNTGYALYDFWMGRELFPQIGRIDVKILLHRICNINGLILSLLIFTRGISLPEIETVDLRNYSDMLMHLKYEPTLLVFSSMQLIYFLNLILNEHKIKTTFSWHSEGVGYMQTVSSALYPFYLITISKFILDNKVSLPTNVLIAASLVYLTGYMIYLISNNIKHEFRTKPQQPKFAHMETMPTFVGKWLLISGPWGMVRHPNYLGDIILHAALAVPGALAGPALAVLPSVTTALILAHRAARDSERCRRRYGAAWQRYSMKVPNALLPKIY